MYEDLLDLADTIETVHTEMRRQGILTSDPKLGNWFNSNARLISRMKTELVHHLSSSRSASGMNYSDRERNTYI